MLLHFKNDMNFNNLLNELVCACIFPHRASCVMHKVVSITLYIFSAGQRGSKQLPSKTATVLSCPDHVPIKLHPGCRRHAYCSVPKRPHRGGHAVCHCLLLCPPPHISEVYCYSFLNHSEWGPSRCSTYLRPDKCLQKGFEGVERVLVRSFRNAAVVFFFCFLPSKRSLFSINALMLWCYVSIS